MESIALLSSAASLSSATPGDDWLLLVNELSERTASRSSSSRLLTIITRHPFATSCRENSRPIPELPPVTRAVMSFKDSLIHHKDNHFLPSDHRSSPQGSPVGRSRGQKRLFCTREAVAGRSRGQEGPFCTREAVAGRGRGQEGLFCTREAVAGRSRVQKGVFCTREAVARPEDAGSGGGGTVSEP